MIIKREIAVSIAANYNDSFAKKLGSVLRRLAGLIDGRISLALDIKSSPAIHEDDIPDCIGHGITKMRDAVMLLALEEDTELFMREHCSWMYDPEPPCKR